jgi:hypothetical protein
MCRNHPRTDDDRQTADAEQQWSRHSAINGYAKNNDKSSAMHKQVNSGTVRLL